MSGSLDDYQDQLDMNTVGRSLAQGAPTIRPVLPMAPVDDGSTSSGPGGALDAASSASVASTTQDTDQPSAQPATPGPNPPGSVTVAPDPVRADPLGFDPHAQGFSLADPDTQQAKDSGLRAAGDAAWTGVLSTGQDLLGAASLAMRGLGADPSIVAHIQAGRADLQAHIDKTIAGMAPEDQAAMHASLFSPGTDPNNPTWAQAGVGRTAGLTLAGLVPTIVSALLPGGLASKAVIKGVELAGAGAVTADAAATAATAAASAAKAGKIANTAVTAATFGLQNAGQLYNGAVDTVDNASHDDLMKSPYFAELIKSGVSDQQARSELLNHFAPQYAAMGLAVGAVAGGAGGALLKSGIAGGDGLTTLGRMALGSGEGAALMGGQGAANDAITQNTNQDLGTQQGYNVGQTVQAGVSGALGGALLGAGGAAMHGPAEGATKPTDTPGPNAAMVAPDASAALSEQLQLSGPKPQLQLTFDPDRSQGAGFTVPQARDPVSPGMPEGALQQALSLQMPAPPPGIPDGAQQGELFPDSNTPRPGQPAPQAPVSPGANPGQTSVQNGQTAPVAAASASGAGAGAGAGAGPGAGPGADLGQTAPQIRQTASAPTPLVGAPTTRAGLVKALVGAGEAPQALNRMKLTDLQRRYAASGLGVDAGPANTTLVNDPGTAAAAAPAAATPPDGVVTSPLAEAPATPPDATGSAPAGVAPDQTPPQTPNQPATTVEGASPASPELDTTPPAPTPPPPVLSRRDQLAAQLAARRTGAAPTVDAAAAEARDPTPAQAEAGNYQKGHANVGGLDVSVETPKGGVRRGVGPDGKPWEATMPAHYGYIKGSEGADGDHVDVALGPHADQAAAHPVHVVDQIDPRTRMFDEHKSMVGFNSPQSAVAAYDGSFSDGSGPTRRGAVTAMPFDQFKDWVKNGDTTTPIAFKPTKGDELRAARAARKAAMAPPGERMRGTVATGEAPEAAPTAEPAAATRPARSMIEVAGGIRDAATRAGRAENLPKAALDGWVRDVARIVQGAHSEDEAHEALAQWGGENARIAGTMVRKPAVADRMMQLLTGRGLRERERFAAEAVKAGRGRSAFENEGMARNAEREDNEAGVGSTAPEDEAGIGDIGDAAEAPGSDAGEASDGVTNYDVGEKTRSKATTDLKRIGGDLLSKAVNGVSSVQEASDAYGKRAANARWPTFSHFISSEIDRLSDEGHVRSLLDQIHTVENDRTLPMATRRNQLKALQAQFNETEPDHIDRLRSMRAELDDPVGAAAAREAGGTALYRLRAARDGISPDSSRFARATSDPALNRFIPDAMRGREAQGGSYGLHEMLDTVANHSGVRTAMRPIADMATRLRGAVANLPVLSPDEALRRGFLDTAGHAAWNDPDRMGAYQPAGGSIPAHIILNPRSGDVVQTALHEAFHAATADHLSRATAAESLSGKLHPDLEALRAIGQELSEHMDGASPDLRYALTNPHELLTGIMTDPALREFAANRVASGTLRGRLSQLGYTPREPNRSVWRHVTDWVRRAIGLRAPASASEHSLLDHVLRPAENVTERAMRHNADMLPRDPVLRAQAEPMYRMASSALGPARDEVVSRLGNLRDTVRPAVLAATTTDATEQRYRAEFNPSDHLAIKGNPLTRFRDAGEKIAHRGKLFMDKFSNRANDRVKQFAALKGEDQTRLAQLMNDATIADARLGADDPGANAHLTRPEQQAKLAELQQRFSAMPEASRDTYRAMRDYYGDSGRELREAELKGVLNGAFPDATDAQRNIFSRVGRSKAGFEQFLVNPDNSEIARSFGDDWTRNRALSKALARALQVGHVKGDYFPLQRYGRWVVRYGDPQDPESYGSERYERQSEAQARYDELLAKNTPDLQQVDLNAAHAVQNLAVGNPIAGQVEAALGDRPDLAEHAGAVRDVINKILLDASTRTDGARARRQGIQGASTDVARTLGKHFVDSAARVGYLEHGGERFEALKDMHLVAADLARHGGRNIAARQVTAELQKRVAAQENPGGVLASLTRGANTYGYMQSLMSFSHMLTSSIETHTNSTSMLGSRHGVGRTSLALAKALRDIAPSMATAGVRNTVAGMRGTLKDTDWNLAHYARDRLVQAGARTAHMDKLFGALDQSGLLDHTMIRELRRIANPSGPVANRVGQGFQRFTDFMGASAHAVDVMNRAAVAKAAFDLELRRNGGDADKAVDYAMQSLRNATPNYNLANKARVATSAGPLGSLAAPLMQFKMYGLHMYGVLGNLVKTSMHGETPEARNEARRAFAGVLATHAMMAGGLTLIADPLRYIGGLYDWITGADKPHDYQADVRGWASDTFGPELGEILSRGLPQALGIDLHRRVGLSNLLEIPDLDSFDSKGVIKMLGTAMIGAAGEDVSTAAGGMSKFLHGDIWGGLQDTAPRPVRDVMKAIGLSDSGVTSGSRTLVPASSISTRDVIAQSLGFTPSRVSEAREGASAVMQAEGETKAQRLALSQAFVRAAPADRSAVMAQVTAYNQANPGMRITVDQLMRDLAQSRKQAAQAPGAFGLRLPPKAAAALQQAGRFANVN